MPQFRNLGSAEESIRKLDAAYRDCRQASDRSGMRLVRSLVLKGKQRAASMARNPKINASKREEKAEIADWFRIWLESPDLFFEWLELRKQTADFQGRFAVRPGAGLSFAETDGT